MVHFRCLTDQELVLHAACNEAEMQQEGKCIIIFPNYLGATQLKQGHFKGGKKALCALHIKFAVLCFQDMDENLLEPNSKKCHYQI